MLVSRSPFGSNLLLRGISPVLVCGIDMAQMHDSPIGPVSIATPQNSAGYVPRPEDVDYARMQWRLHQD